MTSRAQQIVEALNYIDGIEAELAAGELGTREALIRAAGFIWGRYNQGHITREESAAISRARDIGPDFNPDRGLDDRLFLANGIFNGSWPQNCAHWDGGGRCRWPGVYEKEGA